MTTTSSEESLGDGYNSDIIGSASQLDGNASEHSFSDSLASDSCFSDSQQEDKQRVQKKRKQAKRKSLSEAVSAILRLPIKQEVAAPSAPSPRTSKKGGPVVLSRRRAPERKLAEARLEAAARRFLRTERLAKRNQHHQPSTSDLNREKRLRRVATRGVVQVLNAISAKMKTEKKDALRKDRGAAATLPDRKKSHENAPAVIGKEAELKMSFLELLKANMSTK